MKSPAVRLALVATVLVALVSGCSGGGTGSGQDADGPGKVDPVPFGESGRFGGTARPSFPAGQQGELSVVAVGELTGTNQLDFVLAFRNNTDVTMGEERLRVIFEADGHELESTYTLPSSPAQLAPGEVGLVAVAFTSTTRIRAGDLDDQGVEVRVEPNGTLRPDEPHNGQEVSLIVEESVNKSGRITATVVNRSGHGVKAPFRMMAYCFSGGRPEVARLGKTYDVPLPPGPLADGDSFTFDMGHAVKGCRKYAVAVSGLRL